MIFYYKNSKDILQSTQLKTKRQKIMPQIPEKIINYLPQLSQKEQQKVSQQQQINFDKEIFNKSQFQVENEKFKIINQIDINEKWIALGTVDGLYIMSTKRANGQGDKKIKLTSGDVIDCAFLPKTNFIAYCVNKRSFKQDLYIYNWKEKKLAAKVKMQFEIEQIKTSKSCISLTNFDEIFVIYFPSLKPIYNGPAGNGAKIIYDISYQGLTIAHNFSERGQLIIKNFTNIKRSNAITQRKKSFFSSRVKMEKSKISQAGNAQYSASIIGQEQVEPTIKIKAHIEALSQIKLSPNGSKVVTSSLKGTVLRVFSTKKGNKLQQFRVGYELLKIVDINFVSNGNIVGCMNQKGSIMLYNVSMDKEQKQYETQRIGHKIYTQNNQKSFFSFLSIFYSPLNDSFPFNHYKLINPQYKQDPFQLPTDINNMNRSFSKSQSMHQDQKSQISKDKNMHNHSIVQLDEEHFDQLTEKKQTGSLLSDDTSKKQTQQKTNQLQVINNLEPNKERMSLKVPKNSVMNRSTSPQKSNSLTDLRSFSSRSLSKPKYVSIQKKQSSISARTQKSKKQQKFQRPYYNLVSKLYITQGNYIWAIKGYHIFGLKYDSFHGGEMVLDFTTKIQ